MHSTFRRTERGNFYAVLGGKPCTVYRGRYGRWSYFLEDNPAGRWFDDADDAIDAAVEEAAQRKLPPCLRYFGLTWPVRKADLMERYRAKALATHPDRGGSGAAFKQVQAAFEAALALVGGAT